MQSALGLMDGGWDSRWCATGVDALDFLSSDQRDVTIALVDLGLPDQSGLDVIRAFRRRFPATPVLVLTVMSAADSVVGAIRAGAQGYLLKGGSVESTAAAIQQTLDGAYPISPAVARTLFRLAGAPKPQDASAEAFGLTPRELEALRLLSSGLSYKETAREMGVTPSTLQSYVRQIYRKLDVHSQVQATLVARQHGVV